MHPVKLVKQYGTALFAAMGTNTWLVPGLAATEGAVPAVRTSRVRRHVERRHPLIQGNPPPRAVLEYLG